VEISRCVSPLTVGEFDLPNRLKLAGVDASFPEYGDFADYFGSRWHYYLGAIIATIRCPSCSLKTSLEAAWRQRFCWITRKTRIRIWMSREEENDNGAVGFAAEIHGPGV